MNKWIYGRNDFDDGSSHFYIMILDNSSTGMGLYKVIFQVQVPSPNSYMWIGLDKEIISPICSQLIEVLPKYIQDVCFEHNGFKRMSDFPDVPNSFMKAHSEHIDLCCNEKNIQIAGCDPDYIGEDFCKNFVLGLGGDWKGINFSNYDNPLYREDRDD